MKTSMQKLLLAVSLVAFPVAALALAPLPRRVEIKVTGDGYTPSKITAAPGETLTLVFRATADMGCCDQIVVAGQKVKVEKDKVSEATVTVPASGTLTFACSMSMCKGTVGK